MTQLVGEHRVLQWIGGLPGRWEVAALGTRLRENKSSNKGMIETQVLSLSYGRVVVKPQEKLRGLVPASFETYQILELGDIVIRPTDLQNDHTSLRIGQSTHRGIITSAYIAVRPQNGLDQRYAAFLLSAYDFMKVFYGFGSGLRQNLDFKHIKHIPIPVPPLEEQRLIVRYLDNAELRIAQAIAGKNQVLSLLREAKASIISELVIGQSSNMKETGVLGLGDVPSHWRVLRGKSVWRAVDVRSTSGQEERLSVSSARGIVPRASANVTMFQAASYVGHKVVRPGDLVINSLWAWAMGLGVSKHHGIVSPVYGVYELVDSESDTRYLDYFLRSNVCQWQFQVRSKGIWKSRLSLTDEAFLDMTMVLPPLAEQRTIADLIEERTCSVDKAMDAVTSEITLLREYRAKLISDVVTGKLDVREEAAKMSDVDPAALVTVLAGGSTNSDTEEDDDNADN